jgi:transposase-like protein
MKQKPMNLTEFQKKFSTEEACQKHLFHIRWPNGYQCPRCAHNQAYFHLNRHLYQCKECGYQASLTAGTIFHKTRIPLVKWFCMIFLMGRQKSDITLTSMQRMLDIDSYKAVWTISHKIRKAISEYDAQNELAELKEIDDTCFSSPKQIKRGSEDDICREIDVRVGENVTACTGEMFDQLLSACLNCHSITFTELTS